MKELNTFGAVNQVDSYILKATYIAKPHILQSIQKNYFFS